MSLKCDLSATSEACAKSCYKEFGTHVGEMVWHNVATTLKCFLLTMAYFEHKNYKKCQHILSACTISLSYYLEEYVIFFC